MDDVFADKAKEARIAAPTYFQPSIHIDESGKWKCVKMIAVDPLARGEGRIIVVGLTPDYARELSRKLITLADEVEKAKTEER